jgi:hypothetical protein
MAERADTEITPEPADSMRAASPLDAHTGPITSDCLGSTAEVPPNAGRLTAASGHSGNSSLTVR